MKHNFEFHSHEEEILSQAYERALSGRGQEQIDMERFVEDYGLDNVQKDKERLASLETIFEAEMTPESREALRLGTILEAIVIEQVELNEWFGPDVRTRKASRYDDVINGVDAIAEIEQENTTSHLALAIDVTHGVFLQEKFDRIKREIDEGMLTTVKYFENSEGTFRGKLFKVPRVVLGTQKQAVIELAKLWVEGNNKALASHPVQIQLLKEIKTQLESFKEYALKTDKEDIARAYERQLRTINSILDQPSKQSLAQQIQQNPPRHKDQTQQTIELSAKKLVALAEFRNS